MAGDFNARINNLIRTVGIGELEGSVLIDQVYAQYQHEGLNLKHPGGGKSHFLTDPLIANFPTYYQWMATDLFSEGGPKDVMKHAMEDLNDSAYNQAPKFFRDLAWSGAVRVKVNGTTVILIPAGRKRLTKAELRAKSRLWNKTKGGQQ